MRQSLTIYSTILSIIKLCMKSRFHLKRRMYFHYPFLSNSYVYTLQ